MSNSTAEPTTSNRRGTIDTLTPSAVVRLTASSIVSESAVVGIRNTRWTSSSRTTLPRSSNVSDRLRRDLAPQSARTRRSSSSGRNPTTSMCAPGSQADRLGEPRARDRVADDQHALRRRRQLAECPRGGPRRDEQRARRRPHDDDAGAARGPDWSPGEEDDERPHERVCGGQHHQRRRLVERRLAKHHLVVVVAARHLGEQRRSTAPSRGWRARSLWPVAIAIATSPRPRGEIGDREQCGERPRRATAACSADRPSGIVTRACATAGTGFSVRSAAEPAPFERGFPLLAPWPVRPLPFACRASRGRCRSHEHAPLPLAFACVVPPAFMATPARDSSRPPWPPLAYGAFRRSLGSPPRALKPTEEPKLLNQHFSAPKKRVVAVTNCAPSS